MQTDAVRPSGIWSVEGPPGSAMRAIQTANYLKTHGAEHDAGAAALRPHFTSQRIDNHFKRLKSLAIENVERWPVDTQVDLYELVRRCGQRAAFTLLFGEENVARNYAFGDHIFEYHRGNWKLAPHLFPFDLRGTPYHQLLQRAETLKSFITDWVTEERGHAADRNLRSAFANLSDTEGNPPSPEKIAAYFTFFGFASFETMSSALTWTLLLLALHPEVLADLLDELADGPALDGIDREDLSSKTLLDGVIKEALRLIPPMPTMPFRVFSTCAIAGRTLYKSTKIYLSPHLTHRLPDIYEAPKRFAPERWLRINPSAFEYLPFSAGPRRCPGHQFGTDFMKVTLAAILTRYRLDIAPGARLDWVYTGITTPKRGMPIRLRPQDRVFRASQCSGGIFDFVELGERA
jgi:cytochrome P450